MRPEYHKYASEIGKTQLGIFEITRKRNERSTDWTKTFEGLLLSPALIRTTNQSDVEKVLNEADSMFNAVQSATWRLIATGDQGQKQVIVNRTGGLDDTLDSARSIISDTGLLDTINSLAKNRQGIFCRYQRGDPGGSGQEKSLSTRRRRRLLLKSSN